MQRYVFDVNEGDSLEWDDHALDCDDRAGVEQYASKLVVEAGARMAARGAGRLPSTVVVYEEDGDIVLSAHGCASGTVRLRWTTAETSVPLVEHYVREHARDVLMDLIARLGGQMPKKSKP